MPQKRLLKSVIVATAVLPSLTYVVGCRHGQSPTRAALHEARSPTLPAAETPGPADRGSISTPVVPDAAHRAERVEVVKGRVGIIVGEPIITTAAGADAATRDFGAGCARWLQFVVGGQGALGLTPMWGAGERAAIEMNRKDARFARSDAADVARRTGATQIAVGEIGGSAANLTLTYQLVQASDGKAVGAPLIIRGTQDQLVSALPRFARDLAMRLGVRQPDVPAAADLTGDDLRRIGQIPWTPKPELPAEDQHVLVRLAARSPLCALLALAATPYRDEARYVTTTNQLVAKAPENALVYSALTLFNTVYLVNHRAQIDSLAQRYPQNYSLATARTIALRGAHAPEEHAAAERVVAIAPRNPDAWLTWGASMMYEIGSARQGRTVNQITPEEMTRFQVGYREWAKRIGKAVEIDPSYAKAWSRLAMAATFAGDFDLADKALWRCLALDKDNADALSWGMQMYQPKWHGDPDKLIKVARMAVAAFHYDARCYKVADALKDAGQEAEAARLTAEVNAKQKDLAQHRPNDFQAQFDAAWGLKERGRYAEAERAFRDVLRRFPNEVQPRFGLAQSLDELGRYQEAVAELRAFLASHPDHVDARIEMGYALRKLHQLPEAETNLKQAQRLAPRRQDAYAILGDTYLDANRPVDAIAQYRRSLKIWPRNETVLRNYSLALGRAGRFADAIQAGEAALRLNPADMEAHQALVYPYGMTKQFADAERECRTILRSSPNDVLTHENLGDSLVETGHRAEAQAEWNWVLAHDPNGSAAKEAREMLAKYP